jgi:DNA-binding transcriptional regulator YiaG
MTKEALRECLKRIDVPVSDLALLIGVSVRSLRYWLAGRPIPRATAMVIFAMAKAMDDAHA